MKCKRRLLMFVSILVFFLAGCVKDQIDPPEDLDLTISTDEMVEEMLSEVEQPELMELNAEEIEYFYGVDVHKLEEYTVRVPLMNVNANELSILKVKHKKDVSTVVTSINQRAEDVQKLFQKDLPDQYEIAKNNRIETNGKYILFVISEDANTFVEIYEHFFEVE